MKVEQRQPLQARHVYIQAAPREKREIGVSLVRITFG